MELLNGAHYTGPTTQIHTDGIQSWESTQTHTHVYAHTHSCWGELLAKRCCSRRNLAGFSWVQHHPPAWERKGLAPERQADQSQDGMKHITNTRHLSKHKGSRLFSVCTEPIKAFRKPLHHVELHFTLSKWVLWPPWEQNRTERHIGQD